VVLGVGGSLRGGAGSVEGWRLGSAWWSEIVGIRDEFGGLRPGWFGESVLRKVGDGTKTLFWSDPWLGGIPLSARFGRLFDLALTKSCSVDEIFLSCSTFSFLWAMVRVGLVFQ
jgi:hypothetical protein